MCEAAISSLNIHDTDSGWYFDFGATQHISGEQDDFYNVDPYRSNVRTIGGYSHIGRQGIYAFYFAFG